MDEKIREVLTEIANDPKAHESVAAQAFRIIVEEAHPASTDAERMIVAETLVLTATVVAEFVDQADMLGLGMIMKDDLASLYNSIAGGAALYVADQLVNSES